MNLKILFVEDDDAYRTALVDYFNGKELAGHTLVASSAATFPDGITMLSQDDFDIVVLDLFEGNPIGGNEKLGLDVLESIQESRFIPTVFYSGMANEVEELRSEIVGVVNKGDDFQDLTTELERIISSNLALIRKHICDHIRELLRKYFWETVHAKRNLFPAGSTDESLGYILLRRIANSLSKENIKVLLGDESIEADKIHPIEFYVYPTVSVEYEAGEIVEKDGNFFVLLTPSCDYVERFKGDQSYRKVGKVLLASAADLGSFDQYKNYKAGESAGTKKKLASLLSNNETDRYFFLPGTPFLPNSVVDFQSKIMVEYEELETFTRVAKIDSPMAESLVARFIRYYNRIGFPDLDIDFVIDSL